MHRRYKVSCYNPIMIRFKPAVCLANGHLQTLFPALFSRPEDPKVTVEILELDDGDFVECVWHQKPKRYENTPIMILFHGLAGSFESPYIKRAMGALGKEGFAVVLMHFRGCGKEINRLPRSYHSGETEDAKALIRSLQTQYPKSPLYALGYSLGGNMLLKMLGEFASKSPLKSAMAVCAPMQLDSSSKRINRGFSKLYQYRLMRLLKHSLEEKYKYHDMESLIGLKREDVKKLRTFWEFDDVYTAPIHGFKDAREYYEKSSSKQYLKEIVTPTLIVHAEDDPFMGKEVVPKEDALSESVTLELCLSGGHVGFVTGSIFSPKYWLESRIVDFFTSNAY